MTNNSLFEFNRQEAYKNWEPIPGMNLDPELIQYFNHKIETEYVDISERNDGIYSEFFVELEETDMQYIYLKYLALKHIRYVLNYIEKTHNIILDDWVWNVKEILNEMANNEIDEDYYYNTIDIYEGVGGYDEGCAEVCYLIDQAILRGNQRMLYYLIYREDEQLSDRLSETLKKNKVTIYYNA